MALSRFVEIGRLAYNGYVFNGTTTSKGLTVSPQYDRSGRTVIYNEWTLSFVTWVESGSQFLATDAVIQDMVNRLEKPAGELIFEGRGIGNPTINLGASPGPVGGFGGLPLPPLQFGASQVRDVKWGPKPEKLIIEPVGRGRVCKVTWTVTFRIPNCVNARYTMAPLELSYTVSHEIHDDGTQTRTMTGFLGIPITRAGFGDRMPADSADLYREQITPRKVPGFARRFGPWGLNEDRTQLSFTIIDDEMGRTIPPKNVVQARFTHRMNSSQQGLMNWSGSINASYRLKKNATGYEAADVFFKSLRKRLEYSRNKLRALPDKSEIIPLGFGVVEDDAYGRTPSVSFNFEYSFVCKLKDLISASGLFQPLDGDWNEWEASLNDSAHNPYGSAGLVFEATDDYVVDVCDPSLSLRKHTSNTGGGFEGELRGGGGDLIEGELRGGPQTTETELRTAAENQSEADSDERGSSQNINAVMNATFPKPSPQNSYLAFVNEFYIEVDNALVPLKTLPTDAIPIEQTMLSGYRDDFAGTVWDGLVPGQLPSSGDAALSAFTGASVGTTVLPSYTPPTIAPTGVIPPGTPTGTISPTGTPVSATGQTGAALRRTNGGIYVYMRGYSVRAGYRVTPPRLKKLGDVQAEPANRPDMGEGYTISIMANGVHPLYVGRWNLRYYLEKEPTGDFPLPPNPILGSGDPASTGPGATGGAGNSGTPGLQPPFNFPPI